MTSAIERASLNYLKGNQKMPGYSELERTTCRSLARHWSRITDETM
jgi:hypothetical protein